MAKRKTRSLAGIPSPLRYLLLLILATGLLRVFVIQAYQIPSGSMEDSLLVGDFLIGNKLAFGPYIPFTDARLPGTSDPVNGEVVIRPMMYLAVSYDHRVVDGREAVTFLVKMKEALENPVRLTLEI